MPQYPRDQLMEFLTNRARDNTGPAVLGVWRAFLFVALAGGIIWGYLTDRVKPRAAAITLAVLVAADLWSIERLYWIFSPPAKQLFASDPAIDAINADIARSGPGRVLNHPAGANIAAPLGRQDRTFSGDLLMIHQIRIPKGYHGNELGMYDRLVSLDSEQIVFSPQFWRHENVNYWYTGADDSLMAKLASSLGIPPFTRLAGPVRNGQGSTVYAYKVAKPNPYAWVASAIVKAPQNQALGTILDARFDPATVAIVDTSAQQVAGVQLQSVPAPARVGASVTHYAPGEVDISLDQPSVAGQALVVSENYFPGWRATTDGKPTAVGMTNYNLVGIALPAGAKSIQLRFQDDAYNRGKGITLVAILLAFGAWIFGFVLDRRRTAVSTA
jgi:hypothetical protein